MCVDNFSVMFLLWVGLNVKSLFQALFPCRYETRCFKTTIFSNFPRVDFDTFFIWCSSVPADEKSAKNPFVTISSRLIQYNVWTIAWILALYEIVLLMTKQTNLPPNLHITLDALPCTCSTYNIHRGILGTTVNPETCWIRVEGRIRFVYAMCGRDFFKIRNKKYPDSKISGYVWTGPKVAEHNHCTWECNHLATFPPSSLKRERENPSLFAFSIFCLNVWCFLKFFAPLSLIRHVYNNPERRKRAMIVCFLKTILQGAYAGVFTRPTLLGIHANERNIVALRFAGRRLVGPKVWPVSNCMQPVPTLLWFHANGRNKSQHCWSQHCWVLLANNVTSVCMGL